MRWKRRSRTSTRPSSAASAACSSAAASSLEPFRGAEPGGAGPETGLKSLRFPTSTKLVSEGHSMRSIRPAAVAGMFYPDDPAELRHTVSALLAHAGVPAPLPGLTALIVSHAGYIYSGAVAASAYARLAGLRGRIRRVVLLGPTHRVYVRGLALPEAERFATPLGEVPLDLEGMQRVGSLPQVVQSAAAHQMEHSLEVQLPFLQQVLGDFQLLPLAVGEATADEVAEVLEKAWGGDETLIVISSDLSHFLPDALARQVA